MVCEFTVIGDVEKARKMVEDNGGTFLGDGSYGVFKGSGIEGEYWLMMGIPNEYQVLIIKKPWYVRCSTIERKVKEYFQ